MEDYQDAIDRVVAYLREFEEITAIYQIGEVSEPGISDIDLIVVFDDNVESFHQQYRHLLSDLDQFLFMHGLFGMPQRMFLERDWLIPIHNLACLHGHDLRVANNRNKDECRVSHSVYALEYTLFNLVNLFSQLMLGRLKVRNLLCSLKALTYDLKILGVAHSEGLSSEFTEQVYSLRRNWWDDPDAETHFRELCIAAVQVIDQTLEASAGLFSGFNHSSEPESPIPISIIGQVVPNSEALHTDFRRPLLSEMLMRMGGSRLNSGGLAKQFRDLGMALCSVRISVPHELFAILNGKANGVYGQALAKRKAVLNDYAAFMQSIHPSYGMFDVPRDHKRLNQKWTILSRLNRLIYS